MSRTTRRLAAFVVAIAAAAAVPHAAGASERDPEATRIAAAGHSLKWNWTPPGRADRFGHAETLIHAPLALVRSHVVDFGHYRDILPGRFKQSRVVGHGADGSSDVYLQIAVMKGMLTLWDVARFGVPRAMAPGVEVVEGRMVPGKGNIEDMVCIWTLHALDERWTVLKFDMLLKPGLPAPQGTMDEELRDAANFAVDAIHDRAQGSRGIQPYGG